MLTFLAIHLLWSLCALVWTTRRHRIPASAAAWAAVIVSLPVAGTLLYLAFGLPGRTDAHRRQPLRRDTHREKRSGDSPTKPQTRPTAADDRLGSIIRRGCDTRPTCRNRIELLHNGNNAFSALISSLQRATRTIHMEYYIFRDDRIGRTIADILVRKARAGVAVRVIYDAVGSWGLKRRMLRRLHAAGVRTAAYAPLRFPWFVPRSTRRNHRKIVVTDGRVAFLGGINIAKYYLDGNDSGQWRDEHLRLEGDAVADLQRLFLADWAAVRGERPDPAGCIARHRIRERLPLQVAWSEEGPSRTTIAEAFAALIVRARRRVRICSPYFLPPTMLLDALRIAARSGVKVEVMIPATSDSPLTDLVSDSYVDDLLDAGVELYRYEAGFLHAKVLIVDDRAASVGTANMDYRSLTINLEVTVFIRDRATVRSMADTFDRDRSLCVRLDRSRWHPSPLRRTVGNLLRLAAPLL